MSPAKDYLKHQSRKELQRMAKERGIKANIRSDEIINKLLAEGFTPPSSAGTTSGDQPENRAPESPRTNIVDSKAESAVNNSRRRRAALHVKNDADGVLQHEVPRKDQKSATQQRAGPGRAKAEQTTNSVNATPQQARASTLHRDLLPFCTTFGTPCCEKDCLAGTMTQYYTPGVLSPSELYDSPGTSGVLGSSPAVHGVPPAPPAHLKHTPHKLAKVASTPSKSRRQASGAPSSGTEQRASKTSQPLRSLRDQGAHTSQATPLADITAGAQVPISPAQCIADMPSTAAALQRLKQTRSHGRVRSVPAPPPHLKNQTASSSSPPLEQRAADATTSAQKATVSKSKKQTPAKATQGPPVTLSPVPNHLSKRSERTRRTGTPQDPHTILSTRGKRPPSHADHRAAFAAEQAAATAAAAKHTIAVAQVAAMHAAAGYSAHTAALHQQIQQMNSSGRPPAHMTSTAQQPDMARAKSTSHTSNSSRAPHRPLNRSESVPNSAVRRGRRPVTTSSVDTVRGSNDSPQPPPAAGPAQRVRGDGKPPDHGSHQPQMSPSVTPPPPPFIDLTVSPSPPQQSVSPSMNASPTLPVQPSEVASRCGASAARAQATQSLDRSVLAARPPTAPPAGKPRPGPAKDPGVVPALPASSSSSVSTSEAQRTAGQPAATRHRDRTPAKVSARRRKSPSHIVNAIQTAGQARTRPTQAATDTSDPRLRGQVAVAPPARLPEEQKQVELDSALRRLQPPRFSSDGDEMSGSDDEDVDMHGELRLPGHNPGEGHRYKLPRHHSAPGRSVELPGVKHRRGTARAPDSGSDVRGSSDTEAPPMMETQLSLQELMQTCPQVRERRSQRQVVMEGWIQERSRELEGLEESMQVLTLGRCSSGMSADAPLRGGRSVLHTASSSQMDSGALSKSVDQFLLAERAAAMAAGGGLGGDDRSGRGRGGMQRQRSAKQRRAVSRSPLPEELRASRSPAPTRRRDVGAAARSSSRGHTADGVARQQTVAGSAAGLTSAYGSTAGPPAAGVEVVSAANSSRRKAADDGGEGSGRGPAGPTGSKGSGPSPYMASPMAQKALTKTKSTVGALRTPSVPPRAAMMACQRKQA